MADLSVAVVTGAASGIGAAVAAVLAGQGHQVACADWDLAGAQRVADAVGDAFACQLDVRDEAATEAVMDETVAHYGRIDAVVACAGIEETGPAQDLPLDVFQRVVAVNLTGSFLTARAGARRMIAQRDGGRVVLIGSINSVVAMSGQAAYAASKGGVLMLGRGLAVDWGPHNITVNVVGPGITDTPMSSESLADPERRAYLMAKLPLGRPAAPDDIAQVVAFLTSDAARYITGAYLPVDGGWLAQG